MAERDPRALALHYLATHQVMTLATNGPEGLWAAAVFYVNDGFNLVFLSAGHTRHVVNFTAVPHIAATIQEDYRDWQQIKGIQLEGEVSMLTDVSRETSIANYLQKYPFLEQADPKMKNALAKVNWYLLQPERLFFIDNSLGLGHRDEIPL